MLFNDASPFAYSGVLTLAAENPKDLRMVAFILGPFSEMQQWWSETEEEAYAGYQAMLKFDLYLRGTMCVLHCDHKLLKPSLSKGIINS